jgi:hypothetical protein
VSRKAHTCLSPKLAIFSPSRKASPKRVLVDTLIK